MFNKAHFFFTNYSTAQRLKEESFSSRTVVEFLESMWEDHVKWYKEEYPKRYRESLTLEQLARF